MSFPEYPEYRDSDAEWLGKVPKHWKVAAIKWLSPVLRGASPRPIDNPIYFDDDGEYGWVRIADVTASKDGQLKETTQRLSVIGASLSVKLESGKLFLSIAGSVGKPCINRIKACIHDGFVYFPLLNIDQRLLYRIFELGSCFGGLGKMGTQLNLNTDTVGGILIAIPSGVELGNILRFIDHETAKIDTLIHEQKRLIELLQEKRQAMISHAVTKGLDPSVPMKDSGVEWLGVVPAHWDLGHLKHKWSVIDCKHVTADFVDDGYPLASIREVQSRYVDLSSAKKTTHAFYTCLIGEGRKPTLGDLIVSRNATVGEVAEVTEDHPEFALGQDVCLLRRNSTGFEPAFLYYTMKSNFIKEQISALVVGSTFKRINVEQIRHLLIPTPPSQEQQTISRYIDETNAKYYALTSEASKGVVFLAERRSALISAAVTGKIDVRNWQPPADESAFDEEVRQAGMEATV